MTKHIYSDLPDFMKLRMPASLVSAVVGIELADENMAARSEGRSPDVFAALERGIKMAYRINAAEMGVKLEDEQ